MRFEDFDHCECLMCKDYRFKLLQEANIIRPEKLESNYFWDETYEFINFL